MATTEPLTAQQQKARRRQLRSQKWWMELGDLVLMCVTGAVLFIGFMLGFFGYLITEGYKAGDGVMDDLCLSLRRRLDARDNDPTPPSDSTFDYGP
jgi:hypothetical protein